MVGFIDTGYLAIAFRNKIFKKYKQEQQLGSKFFPTHLHPLAHYFVEIVFYYVFVFILMVIFYCFLSLIILNILFISLFKKYIYVFFFYPINNIFIFVAIFIV